MGNRALDIVAKWYTTCTLCGTFVPFACKHLTYHCPKCCDVITRERKVWRRQHEYETLESVGMSESDFLRGDLLK